MSRRAEPWVSTGFVMNMFAPDASRARDAYQAFLQCEPAADLEEKLAAVQDKVGILGSDEFIARVRAAQVGTGRRQSLEDLIAEACKRFDVIRSDLDAPIRDTYLARVRAWIANQAVKRRIAALAVVARTLARDESTLREAIRRYPLEVE